MRFGNCGIPLTIKGGPGHGSKGNNTGGHNKRTQGEKLSFYEKSIETFKIYIF
jgi:hypothetical protein